MAEQKDDDLGRVIDELSRARAEADDDDGFSSAPDDAAPDSLGTKGERDDNGCTPNGMAYWYDGRYGLHHDGGPNPAETSRGDTESFDPLKDHWVLSFAAVGAVILLVRLLNMG